MTHNPIDKIQKYKESKGRVRYLSDAERTALVETCKSSQHPQLHTIVILAIATGARKNEILKLEKRDIDLERQRIILRDTKNDDTRSVPVKGVALKLLSAQYYSLPEHCCYVFPNTTYVQPADIRRAWKAAINAAQITDFRFHNLRHTTASYLAMNGATLAEIAEMLGHKTLQMVRRYTHLSEQHTADVLERMNNKVFNDVTM